MDSATATQVLHELLGGIPDLTEGLIAAAVTASHVADSEGRAPTDPAYVETVDEWLAAGQIARSLALRHAMTPTHEVLKQITSEGTTLQVEPGQRVDWWEVARLLESRSPLMGTAAGMGVIRLDPGTPDPAMLPRSAWRSPSDRVRW